MKKWAIIYNNKVINNVFWSGDNDWVYPFAHDQILPNDDNFYKIGMINENGEWFIPPPTPEELEAARLAELEAEYQLLNDELYGSD